MLSTDYILNPHINSMMCCWTKVPPPQKKLDFRRLIKLEHMHIPKVKPMTFMLKLT